MENLQSVLLQQEQAERIRSVNCFVPVSSNFSLVNEQHSLPVLAGAMSPFVSL